MVKEKLAIPLYRKKKLLSKVNRSCRENEYLKTHIAFYTVTFASINTS